MLKLPALTWMIFPPAHRRIETMPPRQGVLLTGATGLLGQYLLHDLLARGHSVAVLVRDARRNAPSSGSPDLPPSGANASIASCPTRLS
jgi:NAD(P)-dependent dehydrogenase (short-subunit alcohol dehydrogenase family)